MVAVQGLVILVLVVALGCDSPPQNEVKVDIVHYGVLSSCEVERIPDPTGRYPTVHNLAGCDVVETTKAIPASLGTSFGVLFVAKADAPYVILTIEWTHPALKNPSNGEAISSWKSVKRVQTNLEIPVSYTFEEPWEAVPGEWTVRILSGGELLSEVVFDVQGPNEPAAL